MNLVISDIHSPLTRTWLKLGIASLIAAGIFSLLLVVSRTPGVQEVIPWIDFFHTALVVHVNLSVLYWFMSFSCVFWSIYAGKQYLIFEKIALILCIIGTIVLVASPFLGAGKPLINNYIPVLQHSLFLWGISLFSSGVLIQCIRALSILPKTDDISRLAPYIAAILSLSAFIALFVSWLNLDPEIENLSYYEYLFWGSGHILQFSHTCFLLFSWLLLISFTGGNIAASPTVLKWLFVILLLPLLYALGIYLNHAVFSAEHRTQFTELMKYGGLTSLPIGLIIVWSIFKFRLNKSTETDAAKAALLSSIVLFAAGGIIGFLIHGVNVVIPAHYHGSIVGVTLAFMGIAYYLLPILGYRKPLWKMARVQPYIYAGGQLMHILGLAWSGGYGVQRKTAGAAQGLDTLPEKIGMGMMGFGGLISIIGGVLFLVVMIRSMRGEKAVNPNIS
ncbi:putative membrane protein [hydrothermal vent metagenome]|uniref:Putative membrane protein n=1 Tax=hydrothermal vent metagenome TaxID=652676 RepID=A0A3B0YDG5_9ZZZZ